MSGVMFNNIKIRYENLNAYMFMQIGFEETLKHILIKETERKFGSVENFLRKCNVDVDKIKEMFNKVV